MSTFSRGRARPKKIVDEVIYIGNVRDAITVAVNITPLAVAAALRQTEGSDVRVLLPMLWCQHRLTVLITFNITLITQGRVWLNFCA